MHDSPREVSCQLKGTVLVHDGGRSRPCAGKPQRGPWNKARFMAKSAMTGTYLPSITGRPKGAKPAGRWGAVKAPEASRTGLNALSNTSIHRMWKSAA
jgi:hypothetical protein